jgi:hypothetical protein
MLYYEYIALAPPLFSLFPSQIYEGATISNVVRWKGRRRRAPSRGRFGGTTPLIRERYAIQTSILQRP